MNKLKPRRLGHMVLMVRDIQKSAKFYTEVVGLEVSDWIGENMVFLRRSERSDTGFKTTIWRWRSCPTRTRRTTTTCRAIHARGWNISPT